MFRASRPRANTPDKDKKEGKRPLGYRLGPLESVRAAFAEKQRIGKVTWDPDDADEDASGFNTSE